jgi:hypothetical protein|tara:strand:+ start:1753 stop:2178 length:426 start_codon:yes stop_codon:yes gene_type:complete
MSNPWVVEPDDKQIDLEWTDPTGEVRPFWIKVKSRLSIGESRRMMKGISNISQKIAPKGQASTGAEAQFEWTEYSFARMSAYMLDWSLLDENNNKMPTSRETFESLHQDLFELIDNAIDAHETSLTEEKKQKSGKRKPKAT